MGQSDGKWHQLWSLIDGVSKHQSLIASTLVREHTFTGVYTLGDVGGLGTNRQQDRTGVRIIAHITRYKTDVTNGLAGHSSVIHYGGSGDLTS